MGLLYLLPVSTDEGDRVEIKPDSTLVLKSYGLPMIFWGYLAGSFIIISAMYIGIKDPMVALYNTDDTINKLLVAVCAITLALIPVTLLGFFFYEKRVLKNKEGLSLEHYLFWVKFRSKKYQLKQSSSFTIEHFMDAPNMAKMSGDPELRGFQNKGHFELYAEDKNGQKILIDRSSRKADLTKLQEFLTQY